VEAHPDERDIYRITLSEKAESRLGIQTVPVATKPLPRHRTVGGVLMLPDGASLMVTAPVSGTIRKTESHATPLPGTKLSMGETVLVLDPLLNPERYVPTPAERVQMANAQVTLVTAQVAAAGDFKRAEAEAEAAKIALNRAEQLLKDRAGSARDVDDAIARMTIAQESLKAAKERLKALEDIRLDVAPPADTGARKDVEQLAITAPQSGVLQKMAVTDGQYISAGASLFEIIKLETLWVRVPVYVGLLDEIQSVPGVQVRSLDEPDADPILAQPISAPPSADPISATADLYFEVANASGKFLPGERVYVTLPLTKNEPRKVIPRDAVLWDIQGTSWVYVRSGPQEYKRARILIDFTTDALAVLKYGPEDGVEVVTAGAAELFGTEFGAKK
jgi:RND family efflux transporter MFP subunit